MRVNLHTFVTFTDIKRFVFFHQPQLHFALSKGYAKRIVKYSQF